MALSPLILERKLDSRLWGGDTLGDWLGLPSAPAHLAESWQVYEHNRVAEGPFAGRTLADLAQEHGAALLGTRPFARGGADFPLLAKFIDAADHLSVQVHPDDAYAHTVEAASGFHGKTEAWYILRAAPGADLIHGLTRPTNREEFAAALHDGTLMELMRRSPAHAGDTVFVPAGTIHAINAGIMLFEIQQKSDLTYRVYDYDRRDAYGQLRELHVERALDVSNFGEQPPALVAPTPIDDVRTLLVECAYFAMERWDVRAPLPASTDLGSFEILTVIDGAAELAWPEGTRNLTRGESVVLPAALGMYQLNPEGAATLLRCTVP
ncbi:mannose-6-phosphate isomerase [Kouleothrix aurantiaca]|uniref:Phosphohexomutase n=1 Tax=Kouleothrix aurantiaca TaxID=186479 RepID=A0A0P9CYD9_9CHLR|nr:mannose-6-phosphate isomerase [Kouleothrix aurantiaca]